MVKNKPKKTPQLVDHVADSSDEEIDEDEAFNSDDERMYGALFTSKTSKRKRQPKDSDDSDSDDDSIVNDGDDDDGSEASDGIASDDEGGDGGQFMLDLLNNLDKKEDDTKKEKDAIRAAMAHTSMIPESEFSSTAVKSSSLTLDQLMNGITDTKGFTSVKNVMKDMSSEIYENDASNGLSTTKTPVAKVVSDRAERKVHYQEQSESASDWTKAVKQNREAETLDFRPKDRIRINKAELVQKFEPTTDFEKEIAAALEEADAVDEQAIMKKEEAAMFGNEDHGFDDDDLGGNKLSADEYRKRLGELSKMRALMFYEEQKRHHINKIKSKKYRKIRKKKKMRTQEEEEQEAAANDEELTRELEEKAEMERMKERMSLKHRNTSKWAKRVLRRGGNIDIDTRKALSEQIRKGDELKKKMEGHFGDSDDDDEIDLIAQARNVLVETEQNVDGKNDKGIFKLAFMKKGLENQRERAKEEARELLRELEGNESGDESGSNSDEEGEPKENLKQKSASRKEMKDILADGKLVASSLKFGNSNSVQVNGDIDISLKQISTKSLPDGEEANTLSLTTVNEVEQESESKTPKVIASESKTSTSKVVEESNPWLTREESQKESKNSGGSKNKRKKSGPSVSKQGIVNVADAVNILSGEDPITEIEKVLEKKVPGKVALDAKIATLSQDELVKKAFATPSENDIEEDFEKEKDSMRTRDDHSKKLNESTFVSGWGAWAGDGAPAPKPPKKLPKRLAPPEKKIKRRKRKDDGKKNVIINAKRIKKTAKFQLQNIPHPFTSREQYERAMTGAVGKEWNVTGAVKNLTRAEVLTRAGKMIKPINKKAKMKRAPAKF